MQLLAEHCNILKSVFHVNVFAFHWGINLLAPAKDIDFRSHAVISWALYHLVDSADI